MCRRLHSAKVARQAMAADLAESVLLDDEDLMVDGAARGGVR